jgi:hypothetical protein
MTHRLKLIPLAGTFAVCRLDPASPLPPWAWSGGVWSVTRTADELSVVCAADAVPPGVACEPDWRGWRVAGTFDLTGATGVFASLVGPLAEAKVSVFAVSTFDTDYLWVKAATFARAADALRHAGHDV